MHIQTSGMLHSNNGSQLPTFWDLSVPSSRVKQSKNSLTLGDGTDRLPQNVANYQSMLCNNPEEWRYHLHCDRSLKSCTHAHF